MQWSGKNKVHEHETHHAGKQFAHARICVSAVRKNPISLLTRELHTSMSANFSFTGSEAPGVHLYITPRQHEKVRRVNCCIRRVDQTDFKQNVCIVDMDAIQLCQWRAHLFRLKVLRYQISASHFVKTIATLIADKPFALFMYLFVVYLLVCLDFYSNVKVTTQ